MFNERKWDLQKIFELKSAYLVKIKKNKKMQTEVISCRGPIVDTIIGRP